MIADTLLLISLRWRLGWNSFRSRRLLFKLFAVIGVAALVIWGIGVSTVVGLGAGWILRRFSQPQLESLLPGLILSAVTLFLLVSSFGTALGSLFLTNDLDLLMCAPVNRRAVFVSKLLDGLASHYLLGLIGAIPALLMYGWRLGYGPAYYLLALLAILVTPLFPAGISSLLVMLVARFAPARRVREFLGLAAALTGITCSLISNTTTRLWMGPEVERAFSLRTLLASAQRFADLPIPSLVAGKGLAAAGTGQLGLALLDLAGFLILTLGSFAACVWLADTLYAAGWMRMQGSGSASRNKERTARQAANSGWLGKAAPALVIALKDWRVIPRDLRNFFHFLSPLLLLPILYLNFFNSRRGFNAIQQADNFGQGLVSFTNVFAAAGIFLLAMFTFSRVATTAISMEGKSYWLLKSAPLSGRELLFGKFITAWIPFAILSTLMLIGVALWRGFTLFGALYGWFGIMLLGAGTLAVDIGMAVPWANLTWDDPRRMSSGWGALIALIVSALMSIAAGASLCLPLLIRLVLPELEIGAWVIGPLGAIAVTAGVAGLILGIGLKWLPRVGEA